MQKRLMTAAVALVAALSAAMPGSQATAANLTQAAARESNPATRGGLDGRESRLPDGDRKSSSSSSASRRQTRPR